MDGTSCLILHTENTFKLPYNKFSGKGNMPKEEAIIRYRQHTTMIIREALH